MWKKSHKTRNEVSTEIVKEINDKFLSCLDQGRVPWRESWNRTNSGFIGSSGKSYSFMNTLLLVLGGCSEGEFVTLKELAERTKTSTEDGSVWSCFIRDENGKLPKSHRVYYYGMVEYQRKDSEGKPMVDEKGEPIKGRYPLLKSANVWQIDKEVHCPKKYSKKVELNNINSIAELEKVKIEYQAREGIEIKTLDTTPAYCPNGDFIHMPTMGLYESSEAYYCDLFHEISHSTGADKRLKRDITRMDKKSYSLEELVAEISATCILHDKGFATETTDKNSVAYVQGWARALRSDPTMVEKACRLAVKAANYIYNGKK
jgi:antirestriction protein ArdC